MSQTSEIKNLLSDIRDQVLFLRDLGIDSLDVELPDVLLSSTNSERKAAPWVSQPRVFAQTVEKTPPPEKLDIPKKEAPPKPAGTRIAALPSLRGRKAPRIEEQRSGEPSPTKAKPVERNEQYNTLIDTSPVIEETVDTIELIRDEIGDCRRCPLHEKRIQVVHTTGNFEADLMFIGEAPGADEDEQGFPFVGRAGQLLTKIIEGIGYKREEVAIGNINRCRPPGNRTPTLTEAHTCRPFLLREVAVIKPRVIVVMGNTALHNLLDTKQGISKVRGQFQDYFGVKVMPTFHPAYLLRDPNKKREVWEDMKKVRDFLQGFRSRT